MQSRSTPSPGYSSSLSSARFSNELSIFACLSPSVSSGFHDMSAIITFTVGASMRKRFETCLYPKWLCKTSFTGIMHSKKGSSPPLQWPPATGSSAPGVASHGAACRYLHEIAWWSTCCSSSLRVWSQPSPPDESTHRKNIHETPSHILCIPLWHSNSKMKRVTARVWCTFFRRHKNRNENEHPSINGSSKMLYADCVRTLGSKLRT